MIQMEIAKGFQDYRAVSRLTQLSPMLPFHRRSYPLSSSNGHERPDPVNADLVDSQLNDAQCARCTPWKCIGKRQAFHGRPLRIQRKCSVPTLLFVAA